MHTLIVPAAAIKLAFYTAADIYQYFIFLEKPSNWRRIYLKLTEYSFIVVVKRKQLQIILEE